MNVVFTILVVLIILASILLTVTVLLRNGKGGGLASNFAAGDQTFGVRQTADILEKVTWILVSCILVLTIASSFSTNGNGKGGMDVTDQIERSIEESRPQFPPVQGVPGAGTPAQEAPAQEAPATEAE